MTHEFSEMAACLQSVYSNDVEKWELFFNSPNYELRRDSFRVYRHDDGTIYQKTFMAWNLKRIKKLAKENNKYAQNFLADR